MKRLIRLLILSAIVAVFWWLTKNEGLFQAPPQLQKIVDGAVEAVGDVKEVAQEAAKDVSAPPPLRATQGSASARLSQAGVLTWTNAHRAEAGLGALKLDAQLNAAAKAKLDDMFAKQYFEHVSPSGAGPADVVTAAGYAYIAVGENLALGNYKDDKTLVQAWMDSPGHRANILAANYTEIGIAVGKGTYEGQTTWLAVQEFGKPMADCPQAEPALKTKIGVDQAQLDRMKADLEARKQEMEASSKPRSNEERDAYNAKVAEYNALVEQVNALIRQIQGEITVYNGQVQAFNACAGG
jgi:uncharacterized protein YkwD